MFCPDCGKGCPDAVRFCPYCGFAIHSVKAAVAAPPAEQGGGLSSGGGVKIGDVGLIKGSTISSTTKIDEREYHGGHGLNGNFNPVFNIGSGTSESLTKRVEECPVCGRVVRVDTDDYFRCKKCDKPYICAKHHDEEYNSCRECAEGMRAEKERAEMARLAAQRREQERIEREARERAQREAEEATRRKRQEEERQRKQKEAEYLVGELVYVNGGTFQMGDVFGDGGHSEKPVHTVALDDFYIGKYPVTQGQWKGIMVSNPAEFKNGDNYPVETVSWDDVQEFIRKLNQRTGKQYRLPTEAEWEYAARSGGKKEKWAGTSDEGRLGEYAWYKSNSGGSTHPVGQKRPNGLGIYDMSGNVWEWCSDWCGSYSSSSQNNPKGPQSGSGRVIRGGGWYSESWEVRASLRGIFTPDVRINYLGLRLASPVK